MTWIGPPDSRDTLTVVRARCPKRTGAFVAVRLEAPGLPRVTFWARRSQLALFSLICEGASWTTQRHELIDFLFAHLDMCALDFCVVQSLATTHLAGMRLVARAVAGDGLGAHGVTAYRGRLYQRAGWGLGTGKTWRV